MEWLSFLDFAESLLPRHGDKAAMRSVFSRAYFSAYNSARDYQRSIGVRPRSLVESEHSNVPKGFSTCADPKVQLVGTNLDELRRLRHHADYVQNAPHVEHADDARLAVTQARSVLTALRYCRTQLNQDELRDEMRRAI